MLEIHGLEGLQDNVGKVLGSSGWITVDQQRINAFADATGDHQWIHVDVDRAAAGPFGAPIAHGFLTLSLIPLLSSEAVSVTGMKAKINYGCNKVRFPSPVRVGSRLRDTVELTEVNVKSSGIQVVMTHTIEIEGEERPACIAEAVTIMIPED